VPVTIEAPELCGRYTARIVRGVTVGPSPQSVVRRLAACGIRSINNVVDVSNLVMLELGQPVHTFDLETLKGPTLRVRRASAGERLATLDGIERSLDPTMLVVADDAGPVGLAGVIGGAATQIRGTTKGVLVEAAWFSPASVRSTARTLGLSTDASQRFERGCDPEAPPLAQSLAARLLAALAGGTAASGMVDVRPSPPVTRSLTVRMSRAAQLLGYAPSADDAKAALAALDLAPRARGEALEVTVPSWRVDLEREADLVEEIGRHLGYDRIPSRTPPGVPHSSPASRASELEEAVRDRLASLGFNEAFSYAMIGAGEDDALRRAGTPPPLALRDPLADTLSFCDARSYRGCAQPRSEPEARRRDVRLFEVGAAFRGRAPASSQRSRRARGLRGAAPRSRRIGAAPRARRTRGTRPD
jgi:phenylalanyl-tRNA synthetase beta chain